MEMATHPGASAEEQEVQAAMANGESREEAEARVRGEEAGEEPDIEGEGEGEEGPPPVQIEGMGQQLSLRIAGRKPDRATAKLVGGSIEIPEGEFQPGDIIDATCRLKCTEITIVDKSTEATGQVTERERRHKFRLLNIERTS